MRATKPKSYRPLSQSVSSGPDMLQSFDSDDDTLRDFTASNTPNSSGATSSMALLAENYRKLEKSGKLKNWNTAKMKPPRNYKSSFTQLSGKFSKSYQALNRRFRSDSTKSAKSAIERDAHSDNEDPESATPLLLTSKSASSYLPPSKPPRTFKQRKLDLTGDGDAESALIYANDDFSGDILSAIKEMGVVAVLAKEEGSEKSREDRFLKSLPNGGIQVLGSINDDSSSQSSPTCEWVSPTLLSPRTVSPLASEPPARAFPLPPALSPVHEGVTQLHKEPLAREDSVFTTDNPTSPASKIDSHQTTVSEEPVENLEPKSQPSHTSGPETESTADSSSENPSVVQAAPTANHEAPTTTEEAPTITHEPPTITQEEQRESSGPIPVDAAYPSAGCVSSEKPFDGDEFTEFQSAAPVPHRQRSELARAASVDDGLQQEQKLCNKRVHLSEIASLSFDEGSKRMSMISITSADDYYSLDEAGEEEEEDDISNYSAEFPELVCTVDYSAPVCPNTIEEEHHLFSTPPSSPPLSIDELKREKERRMRASSSERSTSSSPRPMSASPLGHPRKFVASAIDTLLRRSCSPRPKSAGTPSSHTTSSRGSTHEEVVGEEKEERMGTLVRQSVTPQARSASDTNTPESHQEGENAAEVEPKEIEKNDSEAKETQNGGVVAADNSDETRETDSTESTKQTEAAEEEGGIMAAVEKVGEATEAAEKEGEEEDQFDDSNEVYEDATDDTTSLEESCEMAASRSVVSVEETEEKKKEPLQKSQSANTSPSSTHVRRNTSSSSSFTRSATDLGLKGKITGLHTRSRSTTLGSPVGLGKVLRRSLEEAPNRSKDEDYFTKLIKKPDKEDETAAQVTTFSDQDFADILRSSLRGNKVPTVRVETADEGADTSSSKPATGGKEGEGKGEGASQNYLQAPGDDGGSPETSPPAPEPVEVIIIPDDITPNMVSYVYLV